MASPITFSQLQFSLSFQLTGLEEPTWMVPGIAPQQFDNAKTPSLDLQTRTWNQELGAFTRKPTKEHTVSQVRVVQH